MTYIPDLGLLISLFLGITAIIKPKAIGSFIALTPHSIEASAEIRSTYGGFFAGIALYGFISDEVTVYIVLGIGWLSASFIRIFALFIGEYSKKNLQAVFFEGFVGLLCLSKILL